ncbi:MAG: DUF6870 family protein [Hominenteromicrobium sp.]|uniref:DUF6870 family protein n=1 Tax=Hominenteromicrobium sp. TaxID=3073581 RepID=UPI0039960C5D
MCEFLIQKKALTFYSQSLICHCNALVLLSFIILPYKTSAFRCGDFVVNACFAGNGVTLEECLQGILR